MRLSAVIFVSAVIVGAASASVDARVARTDGGVRLELHEGNGLAKIRRRGAFLGHVKTGRVWATNAVQVTGYGSKVRLGPNLVRYTRKKGAAAPGDFMGISVRSNVDWRIKIRGHDISGSGPSIRGCLILDAVNEGHAGEWEIGSKSGDWPRTRKNYRLGEGTC
jgi:hypothetical protein